MMWRTFSTVAALSLMLPLGTYATTLNSENSQQPETVQIAQMFSNRGRRHGEERLKKFTEKLDLTDEQSTQIKAIHEKYRQANQQSRQELQQARYPALY